MTLPISPWTDPSPTRAVMAAGASTEVTVHRQPVVRQDRNVHGYAVNVVVRAPLSQAHFGERLDALAQAEYDKLDLTALTGGTVVFVGATTGLLTGRWPVPKSAGGVVLEVPRQFADRADAAVHLGRLRAAGVPLALADYVAGGRQDLLLPLVTFTKVDLGRGAEIAAPAIGYAHRAGVPVIAERVDSEAAVSFGESHGVDLYQGPLFQRDTLPTARDFTAGEMQCLELMRALHGREVDAAKVIRIVGSDPELMIRVLHLVNSSIFGGAHRIDSIGQAVTLLGPRHLGALAASSLVGARGHSIAGLWFVLTRAVACRTLADDDAAYTVGLLSAVASQLRIAPAVLVARSGVSDDVGQALLSLSGPYGPTLAAVLAHEENDHAGVEASGLSPFDVARAYLAAVADALGTATSLSGS
ncbi:EAL and HDOD domain-containing protein [Pengzhenrongella frigida]|uniref:HDOD domain-containing protein n=1 Tax=Pengzhenrongella frigida TaxID=1259133 RepID=A0A4Q5N0M0_9MICO|nr:HDOD domain-containing protein [Cellulomonas sp. HLT2-17]RYV50037.1 HDOD domain-containing protein [Cellulomonas sp. HLT2-17]